MQLLLTSANLAEEFDQVTIDQGHPILADLILDPTGKHLYCSSPYVVSVVRLWACLGAFVPFETNPNLCRSPK